ncbi:MAG: ATP-binding cassette domain-containing protein [Methanomicrobiales archaeon]|nr:ATP-binding cassette domain-containing protein [Methanomicrobiales archaeon]
MEPATGSGGAGGSLRAGSAPEGDRIIRIQHVTKVFRERNRTVTAVDDVSFDVVAGEIFGLLGPNGAGKSTLIRILTTLLSPTSGTSFVGPYQVTRNDEEIRGIIGVCSQNSTLDVELTAYDNLSFYGKLLGVEEKVLHDRAMQLLETADLTDRAHMPVRTFSGGMKRKLEIVRAFLHRPRILFLDEPTIGLDPDSRWEVWEQIERLNAEKTTIILTTHYMEEAEKLCQRIAFMDRGKLIALDTPENHKRALPAGDLIEIGIEKMHDGLIPALMATGLIKSAEAKENRVIISAVNGSRVLPALIAVFERFSMPMTSISIRSPTLEDVFIHLTGRKLDAGGGENAEGGRGGKR